ncbi:MAG: glutamate racemase [Burkholderiaceae bacterium]|jgi:glutamate racemase
MTPMAADAPIGVFDSGIGGLSVLRHIRTCLPQEALLYFSDARYAPYGGRPEQQIEERALAIGALLVAHPVKALVVACNTATAAAIAALRHAYPALIVVGVEPGLKPAAAASITRVVGVLATEATLASARFARLRETLSRATSVTFLSMPCPGLALRIEQDRMHLPDSIALLRSFVLPLLEQGADTLVLGCTHYPFVREQIEVIVSEHTQRHLTIIDTGAAVARQLLSQLESQRLLRLQSAPSVVGLSSASAADLEHAFVRLLGITVQVMQTDI